MFIVLFGNDPELFFLGALLDLILAIIVLVVFFGIGRNLKRIRQLLETKNRLKYKEYEYKSGEKDRMTEEDVYFFGEGYMSDKEIIGEMDNGVPIIKNPEKK